MNSYDVLGVSKDSSDKEIETSYMDLKKKYDPSFNTSIHAYKKYREVIRAYEDIKNEKRRNMYNLKDEVTINNREDKNYNLYDYNKEEKTLEKIDIDYDSVDENTDAYFKNIIINKDISYLYYLLNLNYSVSYKRKIKCDDCKELTTCDFCDGKKVVYEDNHLVWCPKCFGTGKVSKECDKCFTLGYTTRENTISFNVDEEVKVFKGLGDSYNNFKSDVIINFNFYDKDNITIKDNIIEINYNLNKEETSKGINIVYGNDESSFNLIVPPFVSDNYVSEINFNNYTLRFIFTNSKYDGNDITYYLLFNKKYINHYIFFNSDYSEYSEEKSDVYFNEVFINTSLVIKGFGEKGKYGGSNGNLIIEMILSDVKDIIYTRDIEIINTSRLFNLLGGNSVIYNYGFRSKNSVICRDNKYYLFTGTLDKKAKLKEYFIIKLIMILLWLLIPLLIVLLPYNETMYITLVSVLVSYIIISNFIMEVRV